MVSCSNQGHPERLRCEMSQSIVAANPNGQGRSIATASFARGLGGADTLAAIRLPNEVALARPSLVQGDGNPVAGPGWQACDSGGGLATAPVDAAWRQAMRAGTGMVATLALRDGREAAIAFQRKDFARIARLLP